MDSPPFSFPMHGCIFIITKDVLQDYFKYSPNAEFLFDYITYASSQAYACADMHEKIKEKTKGKESSFQYISSLIQDGGRITGTGSYGIEEKDIVFLAGMLSLTESPAHIIIVTKDSSPISLHPDVIEALATKGLKQLNVKHVPIDLLVAWIKTFDSDFMASVKNLYGGGY